MLRLNLFKMKKILLKSTPLYTLSIAAIFCWWYFAFFSSKQSIPPTPLSAPSSEVLKIPHPQYLSYLSSLDRNLIQQALSGDIKMMTALMAEWDIDARILEDYGLFQARKLPREMLIRAQIIARKLTSDNTLDSETPKIKYIFDDNGLEFNSENSFQKFLPQTYVSASFLLALTEPENIVAIPQGFRHQKDLYQKSLTDRIPIDINSYNSEKIYQYKPDIAFVANYSHPSTLQSLSNQGVSLFTLNNIGSIPEITDAINRIGNVIQRPLKAELLTLFMESAMLAIDNHLLAMSHAFIEKHGSPRIMFLQHFSQFSVPTNKTITGQLLERLASHQFKFLTFHRNNLDEWMIPVEQEQIVHMDPDCLIIAASFCDSPKDLLNNIPSFASLSATKNNNIYLIDASPQAPTQYIILAYYDIAIALAKATSRYMR